MTEKDKTYFGGKYGFLERIKIRGIGSPKVIYKSGIPHFDELDDRVVENEIPFANFELMKNGLLIRLNRNLRTRYVGIQLSDYKGVIFQKGSEGKYKMELLNSNNDSFHFQIYVAHLSGVQAFFNKKLFSK